MGLKKKEVPLVQHSGSFFRLSSFHLQSYNEILGKGIGSLEGLRSRDQVHLQCEPGQGYPRSLLICSLDMFEWSRDWRLVSVYKIV